jgi:hypothetical protein
MHRPVDLAQRRAAQPNAHVWKVRGPGKIEKGDLLCQSSLRDILPVRLKGDAVWIIRLSQILELLE